MTVNSEAQLTPNLEKCKIELSWVLSKFCFTASFWNKYLSFHNLFYRNKNKAKTVTMIFFMIAPDKCMVQSCFLILSLIFCFLLKHEKWSRNGKRLMRGKDKFRQMEVYHHCYSRIFYTLKILIAFTESNFYKVKK